MIIKINISKQKILLILYKSLLIIFLAVIAKWLFFLIYLKIYYPSEKGLFDQFIFEKYYSEKEFTNVVEKNFNNFFSASRDLEYLEDLGAICTLRDYNIETNKFNEYFYISCRYEFTFGIKTNTYYINLYPLLNKVEGKLITKFIWEGYNIWK